MATELSSARIARLKGLASFEPRPLRPGFSGREPFDWPARLLENRQRLLDQAAEPYVGITTDGAVVPDLYGLRPTGVSTRPLLDVANALLDALPPEQRATLSFGLGAREWRTWSNISPFLVRHGIRLGDLSDEIREVALGLLRTTLSATGYQTARDVMRLNHTIAELTGGWDELGEWMYWLSLFGTPSETEPWGWQIDGHHLIINCLVLGDQIVVTPCFMGSEPVVAESGTFAGTSVFEVEEERGYTLMQSLTPEQQGTARIGMVQHGDVVASAASDNVQVPYVGLRFTEMSSAQQGLLLATVETYIGRIRPGHAEIRLDEVRRHLGDTYFAWIGACDETSPFYYRVQNPVVLIEFDHQRGIHLQNDEPTRAHIHTVVRTPNGNDYGQDLLRQHYAEAAHHARR
jgi:hypothetical protein